MVRCRAHAAEVYSGMVFVHFWCRREMSGASTKCIFLFGEALPSHLWLLVLALPSPCLRQEPNAGAIPQWKLTGRSAYTVGMGSGTRARFRAPRAWARRTSMGPDNLRAIKLRARPRSVVEVGCTYGLSSVSVGGLDRLNCEHQQQPDALQSRRIRRTRCRNNRGDQECRFCAPPRWWAWYWGRRWPNSSRRHKHHTGWTMSTRRI